MYHLVFGRLSGKIRQKDFLKTMSAILHVSKDKDTVGHDVATWVKQLAEQAVEKSGVFTVALSGGSMPKVRRVCLSLNTFWPNDSNRYLRRDFWPCLIRWISITGMFTFPMNDVWRLIMTTAISRRQMMRS